MANQKNISLTDTQQLYVRQNFNHMTVPELAINIKVDKAVLYQNVRLMGLDNKRKYQPRTPEDVITEGIFNVMEFENWVM